MTGVQHGGYHALGTHHMGSGEDVEEVTMWLGPFHQHPLGSGKFNYLGCCVACKQHGSGSNLESLFWTLDLLESDKEKW